MWVSFFASLLGVLVLWLFSSLVLGFLAFMFGFGFVEIGLYLCRGCGLGFVFVWGCFVICFVGVCVVWGICFRFFDLLLLCCMP